MTPVCAVLVSASNNISIQVEIGSLVDLKVISLSSYMYTLIMYTFKGKLKDKLVISRSIHLDAPST